MEQGLPIEYHEWVAPPLDDELAPAGLRKISLTPEVPAPNIKLVKYDESYQRSLRILVLLRLCSIHGFAT